MVHYIRLILISFFLAGAFISCNKPVEENSIKGTILAKDVREILISTAVGMQDFVYETAAMMEVDLLEKMKSSLEINETDKAAFIAASKPIYEEYGKAVKGGAEMIETSMKLAE